MQGSLVGYYFILIHLTAKALCLRIAVLEDDMVKLSVSQAAKLLGVSRLNLQAKINHNQLDTHEGYLTMADLRCAYPDFNPHTDQESQLKRMAAIKESALKKSKIEQKLTKKNRDTVDKAIGQLQDQLSVAKTQNQYYQQFIFDLTQKLAYLETHCHKADKQELHKLQSWINNQTHH